MNSIRQSLSDPPIIAHILLFGFLIFFNSMGWKFFTVSVHVIERIAPTVLIKDEFLYSIFVELGFFVPLFDGILVSISKFFTNLFCSYSQITFHCFSFVSLKQRKWFIPFLILKVIVFKQPIINISYHNLIAIR